MRAKTHEGIKTYAASAEMFEALVEAAFEDAVDRESAELSLRGIRAVAAAVAEAQRVGTNVAMPAPVIVDGEPVWAPRLADAPEPGDVEFWVVQTIH